METIIASSIAAMMFGGIVYGYIQSGRNAEWSAYSFAAHSITFGTRYSPSSTAGALT